MPRRRGEPSPYCGRPYLRQTAAFKADPGNHWCGLCGQWIDITLPANDPRAWTRGHKRELADGGSLLDPANFEPQHRSCNSAAGARFGNSRRRRTDSGHSREWT